jgi:hypothetical protein
MVEDALVGKEATIENKRSSPAKGPQGEICSGVEFAKDWAANMDDRVGEHPDVLVFCR